MRSVAVSGASSFTGLCIAAAFHNAGWRVFPLLTRPLARYDGVAARRIARLPEPVVAGPVEAGGFAAWIRTARPRLWVHHHHHMAGFRAPDYDGARADAIGLAPLDALLDALAVSSCRGIIHSGTVFEAQASPYAVSKARVWSAIRDGSARRGLPVAKVVIPNPVGPLENDDRLTPVIVARARRGLPVEVPQPAAVADYLPGDVLARRYVAVAERMLAGERDIVARPSGRAMSVLDWIAEVNLELIAQRLGLTPIAPRVSGASEDAPCLRNPAAEAEQVDWRAFWDGYARGTSPA